MPFGIFKGLEFLMAKVCEKCGHTVITNTTMLFLRKIFSNIFWGRQTVCSGCLVPGIHKVTSKIGQWNRRHKRMVKPKSGYTAHWTKQKTFSELNRQLLKLRAIKSIVIGRWQKQYLPPNGTAAVGSALFNLRLLYWIETWVQFRIVFGVVSQWNGRRSFIHWWPFDEEMRIIAFNGLMNR